MGNGRDDQRGTRQKGRRRVAAGDVADDLSPAGIARFEVAQALEGAEGAKVSAIRDVLASAEPDELLTIARWLQAVLEGTAPDEAARLRDLAVNEDTAVFGTGKFTGIGKSNIGCKCCNV